MTEGTTRLLETPEPNAPFGQNVYEHHGGLAQPTSRMPLEANPTSRSLETNPKPQNWVLIGSILVATVALILTALFIMLRNPSTTTTPVSPPAVTRPEVPPVQPPPPPAPPQDIPSSGTTSISRDLVYPGAETMIEVTDVSEGAVLQLQTSDSLDKVVNWYTEKLKPTKFARVSIPTPSVILEAGETKAIINTQGDKTLILLTQGED